MNMNMDELQKSAYAALAERNYSTLFSILKDALPKNHSWAQALMGFCYLNGHGVERDVATARHFYELGADAGDSDSRLGLAFCISRSLPGDQDRWAYQVLREAFDQHESEEVALELAGFLLGDARVVHTGSVEEGIELLEFAAERGLPVAAYERARQELNKTPPDHVTALKWFTHGSELGHADCARLAGQYLRHGAGSEVDLKGAVTHLERAAELGSIVAMHELGVIYACGDLGEVDNATAYRWFSHASALGSYLSSQSMAHMFERGEVGDRGPSMSLALCMHLIAERQAKSAGQEHPESWDRVTNMAARMEKDELALIPRTLEILAEQLGRWPSEVLAHLYETGYLVDADASRAAEWREKATGSEATSISAADQHAMQSESSALALPLMTERVVDRLKTLGVTDQQIHGMFVLLGIYAGTPRTEDELRSVLEPISRVIPSDRSQNIFEQVGDFCPHYQPILEEYLFKLGCSVDPEESVLELRDNGLLPEGAIEKLADANRTFHSLISSLGAPTANLKRAYKESFLCGVYRAQLLGLADHVASRHIESALFNFMPLVLGHAINSLRFDSRDYFLGLENGQIPFNNLAGSKSEKYSKQVWHFQSRLFFRDQKPIPNIDAVSAVEWHDWVCRNAIAFAEGYPEPLCPFAESGHSLSGLPTWPEDVRQFELVDGVIDEIWGYRADALQGLIQQLEYKALVIHVVYSSLTQSLDHAE